MSHEARERQKWNKKRRRQYKAMSHEARGKEVGNTKL
jgi:hypothetical protein